MFERFSEDARNVMIEAQTEARELRHGYVGTEHILLGVLRLPPTAPAAQVLAALGCDAGQMRERLRELVPAGHDPVSGQMPFTPRAKQTLELAMRETLGRGDFHVAPEHILLAIARAPDGVASQLLEQAGITHSQLREAVKERLPEQESSTAESVPRRLVAAARRSKVAQLPIEVDLSPEAQRLLMSAGGRALDDGRTHITIADIEAAMRRRSDADDPPQAASG